jgi:hypothetical protein
VNYFKILGIGLLWVVAPIGFVGADDLLELREAAKQADGQGLKSLVGSCCSGVKTVFITDGTKENILRQVEVRGSFSSVSQWYVMVWLDPAQKQPGPDAIIAQNNRLGFTGDGLNSSRPRMTSYSFGDDELKQLLYSAETYFPGIISGGHFFDLSFLAVTELDGFRAYRRPSEDSPDLGRCWDWSFEAQDDLPPYEGEVWIRDFGNNVQVIGRIRFRIRGTEKFTDVRHTFSSNSDRPALIECVDVNYDGGRTSFVIRNIEAEAEPQDGYTPERFGLRTPSDPRVVSWLRLAGMAFLGLIAVYITVRYWKK